jgi:hypothetical protein
MLEKSLIKQVVHHVYHIFSTGRAIMQQNAKENENNIKAMQLIKLLRKDNLSYQAIATKLNETGYRTRRGLAFSAMQVQRLATQTI